MKVDNLNAVIFSKRQDVRQAIRASLKAKGLSSSNIQNVTSEKECSKLVAETTSNLVVLDWDKSQKAVTSVLDKIAASLKSASHPVFLIASKSSEDIVKLGVEYKVAKVAIGEITVDTINDQITALIKQSLNQDHYSLTMKKLSSFIDDARYDEAIAFLKKAHMGAGNDELFGAELAELYFQNNRYEECKSLLKNIMNEFPSNARVKHMFARLKLKEGDYDGALASLRGAQLISPANVERLLEIGEAYLNIYRTDQAMDAFKQVLEIDPELKEAKQGKAKSLLLSGEINEGLELIRSSFNSRETASLFNTAAIVASKNGKYKEAVSLYKLSVQNVVKDDQLSSRIFYNIGIGFMKWGKLDKAIVCFEKAHSLDAEFDNARFNADRVKLMDSEPNNVALTEIDALMDEEEDFADLSEVSSL